MASPPNQRALRPPSALLAATRAGLLAGPSVLAFFSGGYFDEARAWAGAVAWALVALAVVLRPRGWSVSGVALFTTGALLALGAWTLLSMTWAPIRGSAYHAGQIDVLYLGVVVAAVVALDARWLALVEPVLSIGALVVVGYGLAGRFLPGLIHLAHSVTAGGRLEQPLTYWNGMGALAAIGVVLCARQAGDSTRPSALRLAAAGACAPLGMGLYLTFSRGALFAAVAGVVALFVLVPRREQASALALTIVTIIVASAAAAPFSAVTSLAGSSASRERQGAVVLVLLAAITTASVLAQQRLLRRGPAGPLRLPRRAPLLATGVIIVGLALAIVLGAKEASYEGGLSGGASRLTTLRSDRYEYWRVALRAFADQPVRGVGAGGWAVYWLRYRRIGGEATAAHSLPLQTLAELGLVGLFLLAAFLAGLWMAGRRAHHLAPHLAAGPLAGLVTYFAHAPLDWDWQLPALTAVAMVLAGAVLVLGHAPALDRRSISPI